MFGQFVELVRLEQTLFALPFAYCGMLLAGPGLPSFRTLFWVSLAMFGARTAGMCANRLIDRHIDADNPRTRDRALPAGRLGTTPVALLLLASLGLLWLSAWSLNPLCGRLSPLAALLLLAYSYTKRFTWACHLSLGVVQACAPIGGWLAVTGAFAPTPLWLGLVSFWWVAGFDVLYACQDEAHDRKVGLHSIPAYLGRRGAFLVARLFHVLAVLALVSVGFSAGLSPVYFTGVGVIAALLVWEHELLRPDDLSRMQQAFFLANVTISLTLLACVLYEVVLR